MSPPHPARLPGVRRRRSRPTLRRARGTTRLLLLAALAAATACGPGGAPPPEERRPRNVVLYLVDTLRADRLSCYGYPRETSPHLDRLAARGTLYENSHAQSCWTVPSMISMLSGRYVTRREARAPADVPLLAERLREAGLVTAAFLGNITLSNDRGFQRGCDRFEVTDGEGSAAEMVRRFERWYAARRDELSDAPGFFAWIHPLDPHHPYRAPPAHRAFAGLQRVDDAEVLAAWKAAEPRLRELAPPAEPLSTEDAARRMRAASNQYDGEVRAADAALGRLIAFLGEEGVLDETLIVFASDHGEKLWEHERYGGELEVRRENRGGLPDGHLDLFGCGHRAWFQEELWNTPLVFSGPGFPAGVRRGGLAANLDVYPTIVEALGLAADGLAGESLLGGRAPSRELVFGYGFETTASLDARGRKLIEHKAEFFGAPAGSEPVEYFDLAEDPDERRDLSAERPAEIEARRGAHRAWRERHRRPVDTRESAADVEALRALGYLDDAPRAPARTE